MNEEIEIKKKRKLIYKLVFVVIGFIIMFLFVSLFNFIFSSEPEFKIYLHETEVDLLTIKSGFTSGEEWNTTNFEECVNASYYSSEDWYDFIYGCMEGIGLEIMYSNVSRELINYEFLNLNCEKIESSKITGVIHGDEFFMCEKYVVVKK